MQSGTQSDHVNLRDFKRALAACGIKMKSARDRERAKAIFHKIDADNNGTTTYQYMPLVNAAFTLLVDSHTHTHTQTHRHTHTHTHAHRYSHKHTKTPYRYHRL